MLGDIVEECHGRAQEQQKLEGYIKLERGFATIPLPGTYLSTQGIFGPVLCPSERVSYSYLLLMKLLISV